jgi:predicted ferric reductase
MRALADHPPPGDVDLYYAFTGGPAPFAEELTAIGSTTDTVRVHLVNSALDGRLTADRIMTTATAKPADLSVFLCGPETMLRDLQVGLRQRGVQSRHIHREYFDWR